MAKRKLTPAAIERACAELHLSITMKGSLKSLPENIHWHYKKGKEKGTIEITLLTQSNEIIISCKKNRQGEWTNRAIKELKELLH